MSENPRFLCDFGSPNAYLAHRVIPGIEARSGTRFAYEPVLLGGIFKATGNRSPGEAYAGVKGKLAYEQLEVRRFIARHGLERFRPNPHFPVNTLRIMRGAMAARRIGLRGRGNVVRQGQVGGGGTGGGRIFVPVTQSSAG